MTTLGYSNPVNDFRIGDVVRIGRGQVDWTITGKGATTGLTLRNDAGRTRTAHTFQVSALIERTTS